MEPSQELRVHVKIDEREDESAEREIREEERELYWSSIIQASASDVVVLRKCFELVVSLYLSFFFQ